MTIKNSLFIVLFFFSSNLHIHIRYAQYFYAHYLICFQGDYFKQKMFQRSEHTLGVSMGLFAKNRANLVEHLKKLVRNAIVILKGGEAQYRYCSDHELLFRQVRFSCARSNAVWKTKFF
jgi:hypothetical protein